MSTITVEKSTVIAATSAAVKKGLAKRLADKLYRPAVDVPLTCEKVSGLSMRVGQMKIEKQRNTIDSEK